MKAWIGRKHQNWRGWWAVDGNGEAFWFGEPNVAAQFTDFWLSEANPGTLIFQFCRRL